MEGGAMRSFNNLGTRLSIPAALLATLFTGRTLFASTPEIPTDFQRGYLANSMLVTKEPNNTGLITGVHLVYVNRVGFGRLKHGGVMAFPDGTIFADDVREFSLNDGVYHQGGRKFLTVMVKDSKKYASTGGWGFQAWLGGDSTKPVVNDPAKQCFACHMASKANDYVNSTYLH
jgi:hypothetical protein